MPSTLADVVDAVHRRYPPGTAEAWDAVGLVVGDTAAPVRRVHLAVDPTEEVVDEALALGADLLWVHHPLFLKGTTTMATTSDKGRLVHRLITGGCALLTSHTNADIAVAGVSHALADLLGLVDQRPLVPTDGPAATLVVHVPATHTRLLLDALARAGAGRQGDYERAAFTSRGTGTFRPLPGAHPTIGAVGDVEEVEEDRLEILVPAGREGDVLRALREAHPYEEPSYALFRHDGASPAPTTGHGRVGRLPAPLTLDEFADLAAERLPGTPAGLTVGGDLAAEVSTVAVSGGSGDAFLADARRSGADVYLTADLRHHPASEHLAGGRPYLVSATHWATERPWLDVAARLLREDMGREDAGLEITVSDLVTDPWAARHGADRTEGS
ncbi:Nif3-like dinuclear metal center hexameric protein [Georgenia sp. Z1491]|uniref:Nif3-like dinuclear metal center hexameric protein n=1 Tax=Georgenia sp. Z1491 TaxID=3416707 RepID=UPI003CEFE227